MKVAIRPCSNEEKVENLKRILEFVKSSPEDIPTSIFQNEDKTTMIIKPKYSNTSTVVQFIYLN